MAEATATVANDGAKKMALAMRHQLPGPGCWVKISSMA